MQVRKQQLELDMEQTGSKLGKEYIKAVILSPCLFNFYAEYIMRNAGLEEAQAEIKIAGMKINKDRKISQHPSTEESMHSLWPIHTTEYYHISLAFKTLLSVRSSIYEARR